ncbi:MAG: metabolite traffic protein EboE, partial [Geminicoccaceae bacterium]
MEIDGTSELGHLTYCTNIHAGETWDEIFERLKLNLPLIKEEVARDVPFGVGLRLSAIATEVLATPARLDEFRAFLEDGGYDVFTINGFPYG